MPNLFSFCQSAKFNILLRIAFRKVIRDVVYVSHKDMSSFCVKTLKSKDLCGVDYFVISGMWVDLEWRVCYLGYCVLHNASSLLCNKQADKEQGD